MKQFKEVITIAFFMSVAGFTFAQKGTLKGQVTDSDSKEGVPFLSVYVSDKSAGVTTDFDGNYQMELNPGTYEIIFSSIEYGKTSKNVTLAAGETVTLNMAVQKADIKMETIIVKTDKYAKPIEDVISSMEVIKPNIIENKGVQDVTEALEQAPGLTIVDNEPQLRAGSGYSFGAGSRVQVLVDDLPMLSGDAGRPSWGYIPVENIEQVEVIKGAASVLYGSAALSGVINVRTAYPKPQPTTKLSLLTGVYDKPHRDEAKWWAENFPFWSDITFFHSRRVKSKTSDASYFSFVIGGNILLENNFIGPEPNSASEKVPQWNDLLAKGSITKTQYDDSLDMLSREIKKPDFSNRARLTFKTDVKSKHRKGLSYGLNGNLMYGRSTSPLIWLNNTNGLYRGYPGAFTTTLQTTFNFDPYVHYLDQRGNIYTLNTRVFYQDNNNDNNQANKNTVFYGEFRYQKNLQKVKDFTISAGLMGQQNIGESELYAGSDDPCEPPAPGQKKRSSTNIGVYAQLDKKFLDKLNVTVGGRWEYFNIEGEVDNKPVFRAGISYKAAKATYLRASFGQGFRFPTIAERYISTTVGAVPISANPNLKAESSWNAEAGIKQGIRMGQGNRFLAYVDLAGFVQQYNDFVEFIAAQWCPFDPNRPGGLIEKSGFSFRSVNTNQARVSGIDVSLLGQGSITDDFAINVLAGYTWARPVSLDPNEPFAFASDNNPSDTIPPPPLTYVNTSTDTTDYILKYRYEHLPKLDIEFNYKDASLGFSFRYYNFLQNVDKIFYEDFFTAITGIDIEEYREANKTSEYVFDLRFAYKIASHSKISFIVNNLLNREYALRPLKIDAPRSFALQYNLTL